MNKIVVPLAGALAILACGAASAADLDAGPVVGVVTYEAGDALPWYGSAKVGVALPGSINVTATGGGFGDLEGTSTFNAGFAGSIALGKYITPNVRAELELGVARNSGDSFEGEVAGLLPTSSGSLTGDVTTTTLMAIGYYEFTDLGDFVPYLSAGIGGANVHSDLTFDDDAGITSGTITGSSLVFAARIGAGFQYAITDSVDLTAEYTALIGTNATFTWDAPAGGFTREVSSNVMGHALSVGLKGRF